MVFNSNGDILNNISKMGISLVNCQKKSIEMNNKLNKNNIDDNKQFKKENLSIIILTSFMYILLILATFFIVKKNQFRLK
jgi:hypothetical protein